jgi:hypothetical protein
MPHTCLYHVSHSREARLIAVFGGGFHDLVCWMCLNAAAIAKAGSATYVMLGGDNRTITEHNLPMGPGSALRSARHSTLRSALCTLLCAGLRAGNMLVSSLQFVSVMHATLRPVGLLCSVLSVPACAGVCVYFAGGEGWTRGGTRGAPWGHRIYTAYVDAFLWMSVIALLGFAPHGFAVIGSGLLCSPLLCAHSALCYPLSPIYSDLLSSALLGSALHGSALQGTALLCSALLCAVPLGKARLRYGSGLLSFALLCPAWLCSALLLSALVFLCSPLLSPTSPLLSALCTALLSSALLGFALLSALLGGSAMLCGRCCCRCRRCRTISHSCC